MKFKICSLIFILLVLSMIFLLKEKPKIEGFIFMGSSNSILDKRQQDSLLNLARQTIQEYVSNGRIFEPETEDKALLEQRSAYVTLRKDGKKIGCGGRVLPSEPLYMSVRNNALELAKNNPEFSFESIRQEDLNKIKIKLSVLSHPQKIKFKDLNDLLSQISLGEDGLLVVNGPNKATFLPEVWSDYPDKNMFLTHLCIKAELLQNCWNQKVSFYKYQVQEFEE